MKFHDTIQDHYLGIRHVEKTDSYSLTEAIKYFFQAKGVPLSNVRFLAFDGTNTMSGNVSGN